MKHDLMSFPLLCLIFLSCGNGNEIVLGNNPFIGLDTIVFDKSDTVVVGQDTIIVDKKDTVIVEIDPSDKFGFVVLQEESIDFDIERIVYWTSQIRGKRGKQGGDAYNGFFCQFEGGHSILDIIDIKKKMPITTIEPDYDSNYPCNNADFSKTFYDINDEFPLLYSSQYGQHARCVVVDRIFKQNGNYKIETVQRIDLPFESVVPLQYTPDAVIDRENGFLYVYVTNSSSDFYIYQFTLPAIDEGEVIKLKGRDILSKWVIVANPTCFKQGATIWNGLLILLEGKSDNRMRIIDLENNRYKLIDLTKEHGAKWEPEDIFVVDGELFVASGGTGIYQIVLSKKRNE